MLREALAQLDGSALLVGFSGGLDSTVLLHALAEGPHARAGLRAIHVHHGLHPDADAWAERCRQFCQTLGVPLSIARVVVARDAGNGLEAAARDARHAAFVCELRDGECLVLAHHQDDQAETVLLRLMRASGMDGLGAMRPRRAFGRGQLLRPLLSVPRSCLESYAATRGLHWQEDPSNTDLRHDRNYLRHVLMPALVQRWPNAAAALSRSAQLHAGQSTALVRQAQRILVAQPGDDRGSLSVDLLLSLEDAERSQVLRQWVVGLGLPALPGHASDMIVQQVLKASRDSAAQFCWAGCAIRRWRDGVHALRFGSAVSRGWRARWDGSSPLLLPGGAALSFACAPDEASPSVTLGDDFEVRFRVGGERILLPGRKHHHSLKDLLRESGLPPWRRGDVPLLYAEHDELLAVGDLFASARFARHCKAAGRRLRWRPPITAVAPD